MHPQPQAEWFAWILTGGILGLFAVTPFVLRRWRNRSSKMHPQQKAAWFRVIVIGMALVLFPAVTLISSSLFHRTLAEAAVPSAGSFGLLGLLGFSQILYRAPKGGPVAMDERDWQLWAQAERAGMKVFWVLFVAAGMGSWAYLHYGLGLERVTVPVDLFAWVIGFAGFIVFPLAQSLATLHAYGWGASDGR